MLSVSCLVYHASVFIDLTCWAMPSRSGDDSDVEGAAGVEGAVPTPLHRNESQAFLPGRRRRTLGTSAQAPTPKLKDGTSTGCFVPFPSLPAGTPPDRAASLLSCLGRRLRSRARPIDQGLTHPRLFLLLPLPPDLRGSAVDCRLLPTTEPSKNAVVEPTFHKMRFFVRRF